MKLVDTVTVVVVVEKTPVNEFHWKCNLLTSLLTYCFQFCPVLGRIYLHQRTNLDAQMLTWPRALRQAHAWKVTVNKRSIYHHCHKSDAGRDPGIWLRPVLAHKREISCLFLLSMLPIWFPITSNSNQQQRWGDLRKCVYMRREERDGGGCLVRDARWEKEGREIRSPSSCEHHPPVSYTRFLSQPLQTP